MKKLGLIVTGIFFLVLTFSCNKKNDSTPINTTSKSDVKVYRENAIEKGDTLAYYQLSLDYMDSPYEGFLSTAQTMADKYGYHLAYLDVYYCLTDYYHKKSFTELENLDDKKRELALKYLKLGAEKGNKNCQNILGHYYLEGKFVEKDMVKGNELIKKSGIE